MARYRVLDDELAGLQTVLLRKSSDESITSDSTLSDDDTLVLTVAANEVWVGRFAFSAMSTSTPGFKYAFTFPSSATFLGLGDATSVGSLPTIRNQSKAHILSTSGTAAAIALATSDYVINVDFSLSVSTTAGTLNLQWAQNTSDAQTTVVKAGSFMIAHRIS